MSRLLLFIFDHYRKTRKFSILIRSLGKCKFFRSLERDEESKVIELSRNNSLGSLS